MGCSFVDLPPSANQSNLVLALIEAGCASPQLLPNTGILVMLAVSSLLDVIWIARVALVAVVALAYSLMLIFGIPEALHVQDRLWALAGV